MKEPLIVDDSLGRFWEERLSVELLTGGEARVGSQGDGGSWTTVSDEALEVRAGGREFLAFFGFRPLPADNGGDHLPLEVQKGHSRCGETVLGWYSQSDRSSWGCWYGRRTDQQAPGGSFLQRRSGRQRRSQARRSGAERVHTAGSSLLSRPPALDWRNVSGSSWVDVPVTQGQCGSCYAIAAVHMLSSRHRIATGDASAGGFSPALPLYCGEYTEGCGGGYPYLATKWSEDVGLLPDKCAPLTQASACTVQCDPAGLEQDGQRFRAANHRYITGGEDAIIDELIDSGPMAVSFTSDRDLLGYTGGIWEPPPLAGLQVGDDGWPAPTHSALLVGYGGDSSDDAHWILQNAWGDKWGERGGFRIRRDVARARGLENLVVAAEVVKDERPAILERLLESASAIPTGVSLLGTSSSARRTSTRGHRGELICREAPKAAGDEAVFVRLDRERNFRGLSFGDSAGTETAVQCAGATPEDCQVAAAGEEVPDCETVSGCACDLHGQELPYPGMKALAEKVVLMCLSSGDPVRVLLIGLGGGAISSYLQDRCPPGRLTLENVEKDARVAQLATQFFGFRADDRNTIDVNDGFSAVNARSAGMYDAILVDCFAGQDRVPTGCRSEEFLKAARGLLKPEAKGGGAVLQNIWGRSSASQEVGGDFNATVAAYASTFGQPPRREVVFDAPQSLEYVLAGIRGDRWTDLLGPEV